MRLGRAVVGVLAGTFVFLCFPASAKAQSAENVAVVINENSADSQRIGEHYAKTRGLPASNVFRIRTITDEAIERSAYLRTIEAPLGHAISRGGLQDRLLYLVLTRGVPLRIQGASGATGAVASVDSELTLLYRRLVGTAVPVDGRVENPYFLGTRAVGAAKPFSHREHDIYLVTRLDAYTVEQALALIDRSQVPVREGQIVLDQRGSGIGDQWMAEAAKRLAAQGHAARVVLETTPKSARSEQPVVGYYSWAAGDPENHVRSVGMRFAPGSIAANLASFDARTFRQPPDSWRPTGTADKAGWFEGSADTLVGDLIRDGVTGVAGQVDEAYAFGAVRPEILFPAYLAGFNLAEAFYLAIPALSWQTVVIGDPLTAPFGRAPLSRPELEEPVNPLTGYPDLFGKRRSAVATALNRDLPEAAIPALLRGQAMIERQEPKLAREALQAVVAVAPNAVGALVALAQLEEAAGEYESAIERYRRVLTMQPNHLAALNNLAYALAVRRNAAAEALPFAERAIKAAPGNISIVDTYAWIQHLLGNNELAAKLYDAIVKATPELAEIRLHAAFVFMAVKQTARAETELNEALRLDPTLQEREDVQRLRGQIGR